MYARSGHVSSRGPPSRSPWPGRDEGVANAATTSLLVSLSLSLSLSFSRRETEAHRSVDQLPEPRSNICPRKNKSPLSLTTGRASLVSKRALFNRRRITDPESPGPFRAPFLHVPFLFSSAEPSIPRPHFLLSLSLSLSFSFSPYDL